MSSTRLLRINDIINDSIVDGPGIRLTVFTQGCPHRCEGCHNPQTHDFSGGYDIEISEILSLFDQNPLLSGITLSGGEPFCQAEALAELAGEFRARAKTVVTFTGFTYEELAKKNDPAINSLIEKTDILIDGRFILAQKDLSLSFRGSRNQRLLYLEGGKIIREA